MGLLLFVTEEGGGIFSTSLLSTHIPEYLGKLFPVQLPALYQSNYLAHLYFAESNRKVVLKIFAFWSIRRSVPKILKR